MNKPLLSEIQITPVKPNKGHIAFASFVFGNYFYFSSIAVYKRPNGGYRLVYPMLRGINAFHPINKWIGDLLEREIGEAYEAIAN